MVLWQVRSKSLQVYGRLRSLCEHEGIDSEHRQKCFCLFPNEFFSQTFVEPAEGEALVFICMYTVAQRPHEVYLQCGVFVCI